MTTLRKQAYDAFTQHLLERRLLPGQFVSQRELAVLTDMSLGAVREMIPRLEAEGLIKPISQRGLQIARIDIEMVHDAFQLRKILESAAVAAFIRQANDQEIQQHRDRLHRVADEMRDLDGAPLPSELLAEAQAADWALHEAFIACLRNRIVSDIYRVNSIRIRMILQERINLSPERIPYAINEHVMIVDRLTCRDETGAVATLQKHLSNSHRRALDFDGLGEPDDDGSQLVVP